MKTSLIIFATFLISAAGAQTRMTTGKAKSHGTCSLANSGTVNTVKIECGIGTEQGKQMIEILNKILSNQNRLQPDLVLQKLDEILKGMNTNLPQKSYLCNGQWRTMGPGAHAAMEVIMGGDDTKFKQMLELNNTRQYTELLAECRKATEESPEWLTPKLLCGLAYVALGDKENATLMLKEFDSRTGPAYSDDACGQMSTFLHKNLNYPQPTP